MGLLSDANETNETSEADDTVTNRRRLRYPTMVKSERIRLRSGRFAVYIRWLGREAPGS
jgi:hypothetical protein